MNKRKAIILAVFMCSLFSASSQYIDNFDGTGTPEGWTFRTGDGTATIDFKQHDGIASVYVNATSDKLGIWWALIHHKVTGIDMNQLMKPGYKLRVGARVRTSHARKRINLCFNHQRTTDYHANLMEYDIPDTTDWHTISMTGSSFETRPTDTVAVQLALIDWGFKKYRLDLDYLKVDIIKVDSAGKDLGNPIPYHPSLSDPSRFPMHFNAIQDAVIDTQFPGYAFNNWHTQDVSGKFIKTLAVNGTQITIMRWDLSSLKGMKVQRSGLLELTPYSVQRSPDFQKDFGMVHVSEIIGGDQHWDEKTVTFDKFTQGLPLDEVINSQMIIDDSVTWKKNGKVLFTISQPVLQRLIDGETLGIAIRPLGAVNVSFYSKDEDEKKAPRLYIEATK
jgi:hypothetical protein